jgi:hypothetical protein
VHWYVFDLPDGHRSTGTTGALNFGASNTEGLHIRTKQNDCLMFDLHIKNETPTAEKIQAVYRRYTNPRLMSAAGPAHREAPR